MPNGGEHHCDNCKYFDSGFCTLRQIMIEKPCCTTCKNWNKNFTEPIGPVFSIVYQVKNGAGSYATIPYFKGNRVDTYQKDDGDTVIKFNDGNGKVIQLSDIESYLKFYGKNTE